MISDAGSSLARRRHRPFSLFLYLSSSFVSFVDLLQVFLLFLVFLSSSFVHGCASCRSCHIQTCWLLFLTCSPAPSVTAALVSDLAFEGCVCTSISRSPNTTVRPDLLLSSSLRALNFLPMGKTYSNLPCCERSSCERSSCVGVPDVHLPDLRALVALSYIPHPPKRIDSCQKTQRPITFQHQYRSQLQSPVLTRVSAPKNVQQVLRIISESDILYSCKLQLSRSWPTYSDVQPPPDLPIPSTAHPTTSREEP